MFSRLTKRLFSLAAMLSIASAFVPTHAADYKLIQRDNENYIALDGLEFRLLEQKRLNEYGFDDAIRGGKAVGESLGDATRALGCVYTLGLVRGQKITERFAFQGYISRRIPGVAALNFKGKDYGYVTMIGDRSASAISAFVPNEYMTEFEKVAVESQTGLFRDLKAIFLMERRRGECGSKREFFVVDYIPLDEAFDAAPFFSDAAAKLLFAYEICQKLRRCP